LISFKDFIAISERKQVGILYHFTRLTSLIDMLNDGFDLVSHQKYISFTRNHQLIDYDNYKNDFSHDYSIGDRRVVRLVIDGDKLSSTYKISPFTDLDNKIDRKNGEAEEVINKDIVSIGNAIVQIDVIYNDEKFKKAIETSLQETKLYTKYKFNFLSSVKKLQQVKIKY